MNSNALTRFSENRIRCIPTEKILDNPAQPRSIFDSGSIDSLARSIKQNGILQPLCVRRAENGCYILISGERRLRAARQLQLPKVPCVLLSANGEHAAVLSLIENLQRENLDCFETARGLRSLIDTYMLTQSQAAELLSMSQPALCNKLRLLKLDETQTERIRACGLGERHARALLKIEDKDARESFLNRMIAEGMTAAQAEQSANEYINDASVKPSPPENNNDAQKTPPAKKTTAVGDIRLVSNTVGRVVSTLRRLGLSAKSEKSENERFVEYRITVSKSGEPFSGKTGANAEIHCLSFEKAPEQNTQNKAGESRKPEQNINSRNAEKLFPVQKPAVTPDKAENSIFTEHPPDSAQLCLVRALKTVPDEK